MVIKECFLLADISLKEEFGLSDPRRSMGGMLLLLRWVFNRRSTELCCNIEKLAR